MRKLASIQRITKLNPIPNADKILQAEIMGWTVVVGKSEFKVGDLCVFCEIDSVLPKDKDWAQFMKPKKYRVRTCKLRGCLSQGLALPMNVLKGIKSPYKTFLDKLLGRVGWREGNDVTELLGISKHDASAPRGPKSGFKIGKTQGNFPSFIPKTDEPRIQSNMRLLHQITNRILYVTTKIDGTSSTFYKHNGHFGCCSRNLERKRFPENIYWDMAKKYKLEEVIPEGFALQGEIAGPGIQGNRLGLEETQLFIFNVFDIKKGKYVDFELISDFLNTGEGNSVPFVPIDCRVQRLEKEQVTDKNFWLELAKGKYPSGYPREGIVVRTIDEPRISFKVINNDFLLKAK